MSISIPNMTETWRELKLAEIQADMDQTATSLANRKDESDSSRKKLIVERNPSNLIGSISRSYTVGKPWSLPLRPLNQLL